MSRLFAVIAGGGTAGHVVPAIAVAEALVERGHPRESIRLVGSMRSDLDRRLFGATGFPVSYFPGRGLARRLTVANVASLAGFAIALLRAGALLLRSRPSVVVSMGGYAAAPCALVAGILRIPLVLSEQNAVPTATHRLVARFASASAVPFDGTPLPRPTTTGNPVRTEVLSVDRSDEGRAAARASFGLPADRMVILSVGGSLGARSINTAVRDLARAWRNRSDVAIRQVVGERDWDEFGESPVGSADPLVHQTVRYEDRLPEAMVAADLVVSRSGGSVAEIALIGRASILVPLPIAPYDHQAENAKVLVAEGAAVMLRDHELTGSRLAREIDELGGPDRLRSMGDAARALGRPDAARRVAELIESCANARMEVST